MHNLIINIREKSRIHSKHIRGIILGHYPKFVYKRLDTIPKEEIPIFTFHSVNAKTFEMQIRYLAENNYHSVNADELYKIITNGKKLNQNVVALTFDDGRGSLWSIAYPILKKYGFRCICFIVPGKLKDDNEYNPNLEDVWSGEKKYAEIEGRDLHKPFCTWNEIQQMHASGVVDFQSHTSNHHSVFINNKLIDVVNPQLRTSFLSGSLNPVVRMNGNDVVPEDLNMGQPIYDWAPSMSGKQRYIEDENLSATVIEFVKTNGGVSFLNHNRWRAELKNFIKDFKQRSAIQDHWQTDEERYSDIYKDLLQSKLMIEKRLNKKVAHLCYPWNIGSPMAVKASQEAGYFSNYWGIKFNKAINHLGDDTYYLKRLTANFICTLPGKDRTPLGKIYLNAQLKNKLQKSFF